MPIMLTRKDGPPTPFRNAEYIPFYYFIPKSILSRCGAELNAILNAPGWNRQFDRARPTPLPLKSYTLSASPTPSV